MIGNAGGSIGMWGRRVVSNDTRTTLTVNQRGTGDILDIQDNGTSVFKIADGAAITIGGSITIADNTLLRLGTDGDVGMTLKSTTTNVNTAVAGVIEGGAPVNPALAADSLIIGNITNDGDILIIASDGGTSKAALFYDASMPDLYLYNVGGTWTAGATTWTIPAVTLGGAVAGGDQAFTNVGDMTFAAGSILTSGSTNGNTLLIRANDTTFITLTTGATDVCTLDAITMSGTWLASGTVILPSLTLGAATVVPDGGTIGQAAGPLITFDDTNDILKVTGCKIGVGIAAPDLQLHLFSASAGTVTAGGGLLCLESSSDQALVVFLCPNNQYAGLFWGDPDDNDVGQFTYNHSTNLFYFTAAGAAAGNIGTGGFNMPAGAVLQINSVQVVGARVVDARCDDVINSGDATTDGVIDALRDAMITHGLIAAA